MGPLKQMLANGQPAGLVWNHTKQVQEFHAQLLKLEAAFTMDL